MRTVIIFVIVVLCMPLCKAAKGKPAREVCLIADIEVVEGKIIPQRGIRILQRGEDEFYGEYIGTRNYTFGGGTDFTQHLVTALKRLPDDQLDWNVYLADSLERVEKRTGQFLAVLDGGDTIIKVDFGKCKLQIMGANSTSRLMYLRPYDKKLATIGDLIDAIALEIGREEMNVR